MTGPTRQPEGQRSNGRRLITDRPDRRQLPFDRHQAGRMSVARVPLFEPLISAVVVAQRLPEPGLVAVLDAPAADPFGALPEVPRRADQPGRAAVLRGERPSVVLVGDKCLV